MPGGGGVVERWACLLVDISQCLHSAMVRIPSIHHTQLGLPHVLEHAQLLSRVVGQRERERANTGIPQCTSALLV